MRARGIIIGIAALGLSGLVLVAVSKPSPKVSTRSLQLAEPSTPDAAVASALEVGRPAALPAARTASRKAVARKEPAEPTPAEHNHADMTEVDAAPTLSRTAAATAEVEVRATLAAAPAAPIFGAARPIPGASNDIPDATMFPDLGRRAPTIIIRGGMGSPHDDCKLDTRGRFGGTAVNRSAPPLGGYRGGIR